MAVDALLGYVGAKELYITGQVFPWQIDFYCFIAIVSRGYVPWRMCNLDVRSSLLPRAHSQRNFFFLTMDSTSSWCGRFGPGQPGLTVATWRRYRLVLSPFSLFFSFPFSLISVVAVIYSVPRCSEGTTSTTCKRPGGEIDARWL